MSGLRRQDGAALALVRASARLLPASQRAGWLREWTAELHSTSSASGWPLLRALGAPVDAVALSWHLRRGSGSVIADARHAVRSVVRRPISSAFVIIVLALGIAASSAAFAVVRGVVLAPLPYPDADRLVVVWDQNRSLGIERSGPTPANVVDLRARSRAFEGLAAWYAGEPRTMSGWSAGSSSDSPEDSSGPTKVAVALVTADFFVVMAEPPMLGRAFTAAEVAAGDPVVVLSHALWRGQLGGDEAAVGAAITVDDQSLTIVGVMPPSFAVPSADTVLWVPWDFDRAYERLGHVPRGYRFLHVIARLRREATLEAAQTDVDRVMAGLAAEHETNRGWSSVVVPYKMDLVGDLRPALLAVYAAVTFVLLIALTNAAHLLLARGVGRRSELAIRAALGASRWRVARLLWFEAAILSIGGALVGAALGSVLLRAVLGLAPRDLPRLADVAFGLEGVLYSLAVGVAAATVLGAITVMAGVEAAGVAPGRARTGSGEGGRGRLHGGLVVGQVAAAFTLLVMALLVVQSLSRLLVVDAGFEPDGVLVARVFPDARKYDTVQKRLAYFDELRGRLDALPNVLAVGAASGLPMNAYNNVPSVPFAPINQELVPEAQEADVFMATVGYPQAMGMRLLRGRWFDDRDTTESTPVVIVNETLARAAWPAARDGGVGEQVRMGFGRARELSFQVVGVIADARSRSLKVEPIAEALRPHAQAPYVTMNVVLRTDLADPMQLA